MRPSNVVRLRPRVTWGVTLSILGIGGRFSMVVQGEPGEDGSHQLVADAPILAALADRIDQAVIDRADALGVDAAQALVLDGLYAAAETDEEHEALARIVPT